MLPRRIRDRRQLEESDGGAGPGGADPGTGTGIIDTSGMEIIRHDSVGAVGDVGASGRDRDGSGDRHDSSVSDLDDEQSQRADMLRGNAKFDGRRRRRQAAAVVGVAVLSGIGGVVIGRQVQSPADEAAARAAPTASRITVPVERQLLQSSLVLSGEVQFNEPATIKLAGAVGLPADEIQVLTQVPAVDQLLQEGDMSFEVSGRPVFVFQGDAPMYRRWNIGTDGPDVLQLETSLSRLGYAVGAVDTVFDQATADAMSQFYADRGYTVEGPTAEQREQLRQARDAVTAAEKDVRDSSAALAVGSTPRPESEMLQLRQAVDSAKTAITTAENTAVADDANARTAVTSAQASLNASVVIRDAAVVERDAATRAGAVDPTTDEPYAPERIAEFNAAIARADLDVTSANSALTAAVNAQPGIAFSGASSIEAAQDALALTQLQLQEAQAPSDTTIGQEALTSAEANLVQFQADLATLEATSGLRVSSGEIVFLPILPSTVTQVMGVLGGPANIDLATAATSETSVSAAVSRSDAEFVQVGSPVTIEIRDVGVELSGTVSSIGPPPASSSSSNDAGGGSAGGSGGNDGGSGTSSRLQVVVTPDDPNALGEYVFYSAKIRVAVAATEGEVLVVPVAAVTVGADGASRVDVETAPATSDDPGTSELVPIEVGLTAQGLVEVRPLDGRSLDVGDRVVVGVETNQRRNERSDDESTDDSTG